MAYTEEYRLRHNVGIAIAKLRWGKASEYQCYLCFDQAREWAHLWRTHRPEDPEGFIPLCRRDHIDYDAVGRKHTPEARANMSAAQIGNTNRRGYRASEETRLKIGESKKGNQYLLGHIPSPETRAKMSASHKGHRPSADARAKMSASGKKRAPASPETRAKISRALKGRTLSPETRAKISKIAKRRTRNRDEFGRYESNS